MFMLRAFGEMDYNLFFYFYNPSYSWSDLNGIGHFPKAQFWFHLNWLFLGSLLFVLASLFYQRGITGGFKEKWRVAMSRFGGKQKLLATLLTVGWLGCSAFIYQNVSIINRYTTIKEGRTRSADYEKILKKYEFIPQPKVTDLLIESDIFPRERMVKVKAVIKIKNKTNVPIDTLHMSGEQYLKYTMLYNGKALPYTSPLIHDKPKFSFWAKNKDTLNYRMYALPSTMMPGDTAEITIYSTIER